MNKTKAILFVITLFSCLLAGCVPSLVYSPSVNLPPKPLQKEELQILGGIVYLPETRPDRVKSVKAFGGEATIRYGFTNSYAMQVKSWHDFSDNVEPKRWGLSMAGIVVLNDSSNYRVGIMPNVAAAFSENSIEGGGGYIPFTLWINNYDPINFYTAIGPVIGFRNIREGYNEWGWGIIANVGCGIEIHHGFTLNIEFSGIKQVNKYNGRKDYIFSPSVNIGYVF